MGSNVYAFDEQAEPLARAGLRADGIGLENAARPAEQSRDSESQSVAIDIDAGDDDAASEAGLSRSPPIPVTRRIAGLGVGVSLAALFTYLASLRWAGSRAATSHWAADLPEHEQAEVERLAHLTQAAGQTAPEKERAGKGELVKASLQLLAAINASQTAGTAANASLVWSGNRNATTVAGAAGMPGLSATAAPDTSWTVAPAGAALAYAGHVSDAVINGIGPDRISDAERDEEIQLIQSLPLGRFADYLRRAAATVSPERVKRNAAGSADSASGQQMTTRVMGLLQQQLPLPANMVSELQAVLQRVSESEDYNAAPEGAGQAIFVRTAIRFLQVIIDQHQQAQPPQLNLSYHYYHMALSELWRMVGSWPQDTQEGYFEDFIRSLQQQRARWREASPEVSGMDAQLQEFTAASHPGWHEQGVKGASEVVLHTATRFKVFSFTELLTGQHADFIKDVSWSAHLAADSSGYADTELEQFVESSAQATPADFLLAPAQQLLEARFRQMGATPLYFDRRQNLGIPASASQAESSPEQSAQQALARHGLASALVDLVFQTPVYTAAENTALAFADALIATADPASLPGLDPAQLLDADYIYTYTDVFERVRFDTAKLPEILLRKSKTENIAVANRNNVSVYWPHEMAGNKLQAFLEEQAEKTAQYGQRRRLENDVAQARRDTFSRIPVLQKQIDSIVARLAKDSKAKKAKASTSVTFAYSERINAMGENIPRGHSRTFTLGEVLRGEERRYSENINFGAARLDKFENRVPNRAQLRLVQAIQAYDLQSELIQEIRNLKGDAEFRVQFKRHLTLMEQVVSDKIGPVTRVQYSAAPGLIAYRSKMTGEFIVLSLRDGTGYSFSSISALEKFQWTEKEIRTWLLAHADVDADSNWFDVGNRENVSQDEVIDTYMNAIVSVINAAIRSHNEALWNSVLSWIDQYSHLAAIPTLGAGVVAQFVIGIAIAGGPKFLKAALSDNRQDRDLLLKEAANAMAIAASLNLLGGAAAKGFGQALNAGTRRLATRQVSGGAFYVPQPATAGSVVASTSSFSFNAQTVKELFYNRIARIFVKEAKPVALRKIRNVKEVLLDDAYRAELDLAAQTYFGKLPKPASGVAPSAKMQETYFDKEAFIKSLDDMESAVGNMEMQNIQVLAEPKTPAGQEFKGVAQLDTSKFNMAGTKEKYLRIFRNNFYENYKHMGSSNNAAADLLIHEISHGTAATKDYVYIGSAKFKNGKVDVFDLINLGNRKLKLDKLNPEIPVDARPYASGYAGSDLKILRGSSIDTRGQAGLKNADSITQFISFLDKAKSNPAEFASEFSTLQKASAASDGFSRHIDEAVVLSRARRDVAAQPDDSALNDVTRGKQVLVLDQNGQYALYELVEAEGENQRLESAPLLP